MYNCFLCLKKYNSISTLIWHMKIYHNLGTQSFYMCKQQSCCRDFRGLKTFRQHLNRSHPLVKLNSDNTSDNIDSGAIDNVTKPSSFAFSLFNLSEITSTSDPHADTYEILEDIHVVDELIKTKNTDSSLLLTQVSYKNIVKKCAINFISKLMMKPSVTSLLLQEIVDGVIELFSSDIVFELKSKIMPLLNSSSVSTKFEIEEMFNVLQHPFLDLTTEHHRMKYLISNDLFIIPKTIVVGYTKEKKTILGEDRLLMVPIQGHFISLKKNLKAFFELPDIYKIATQFMNDSLSNNDTMISFLDGTTWKQMRCNFSDKIVFPIYLYYDDVELGNPLGSHSGIHKMGCIYYSVAALPPEYLSALENIFIAFLFHSTDRGINKVTNEIMFSSLINELIDLQTNGISIQVDSVEITIFFALGLVLGDNLGLNSILGFVESFSANYCCRICRCPKHDLHKMVRESDILIRNENNYETDIISNCVSNSGLNERCIFNKVPNFHVVQNMVCDFMHDIPEGVARYDMALVIKNLIDEKYFTLNQLNSRITLFNYGVTERKNFPPKISQNHLNNGAVIMSASEMLCLVRNFGLIVGEIVPKHSQNWKLYILLRQIVDLCCARRIQSDCAVILDSLVAQHNRLYLILSKSNLKPKFHILTHYGRMLLKNGPIKLTSCIRFEAKHKILKAVANAIPCRINLGHTLAYKVQLQMVSRLLSKTGFQHDLKLGTGKEIVVNSEFPALLYNMFPCELAPVCFNASWLKFKGIYYKKGLLMVIDFNLDGCIFGEIVSLLVGKSRNPYFILNPITCIGFDPHYHAYEIENTKEINISNYIGCYINELPDSTPTIARVLENGKIYATLKYAL